jgi:DMSO reductase family type II enzyme heme b subunit
VKYFTNRRIGVLPVLLAATLGTCDAWAAAERPQPDPEAGRAAFDQHCARCHGVAGKGDGRDAKRFHPRPRDLTSGVYKIRTTVSGTVPTDEDLYRTLDHGLTAGGMPDWSQLDPAVRWHSIDYLKTLSTNFQDNPPQPVDIGTDPGRAANLATGKQVYEKLGCAACHGPSGRGNGASGPSLTDDWGFAIRPANLTQGWNYRGDAEPRDIATRMLTGIDGSQMPSYAEATTTEETWHLAHYVRSLQERPRWAPIAEVARIEGDVPTTIDDPRWQPVPRTDVRLRNVVNAAGEMANPPTVNAVAFWALHNGESLSLRIQWDDPTEDRAPESPDVVAVALRPAGALGDTVSLQYWPMQQSPPLDLLVWSAARQAKPPAAEFREALVDRYDPVLQAEGRGAARAGQAVYQDGRWTAVVVRPLAVDGLDGRAAQLGGARFSPVGFVFWDGGNAGQRIVSPWTDLSIHVERAPSPDSRAAEEPAAPSRTVRLPAMILAGLVVLALALKLALKR